MCHFLGVNYFDNIKLNYINERKKSKSNWLVISNHSLAFDTPYFFLNSQELDIKILTSIAHADKESRLEQSEQREQLRREALNMLKEFQQQMKLEKEKEQELDAMYQ